MTRKSTAAIVMIALLSATSVSITGQEEPLPLVIPKATSADISLADPAIVLAVEPIREFHSPTLVDAARNNDYVSFNALFTEAKLRGEDVSRFTTLHELWTYAVTDPIGAFYGPELHETLTRAYPGFGAYIAEFLIVDSNGNVFYPTSETRAFLLDRAMESTRALPRVQLARNPTVPAAGPQASAPAVARSSAPAPARVAARDAARPAGVDAGALKVVETPAVEAPLVAAPVEVQPSAVAQVAPPTPAPGVAPPATVPTDTAIVSTRNNPTGRGLLLVIIGLVGVGLLAVILRARHHPEVVRG